MLGLHKGSFVSGNSLCRLPGPAATKQRPCLRQWPIKRRSKRPLFVQRTDCATRAADILRRPGAKRGKYRAWEALVYCRQSQHGYPTKGLQACKSSIILYATSRVSLVKEKCLHQDFKTFLPSNLPSPCFLLHYKATGAGSLGHLDELCGERVAFSRADCSKK